MTLLALAPLLAPTAFASDFGGADLPGAADLPVEEASYGYRRPPRGPPPPPPRRHERAYVAPAVGNHNLSAVLNVVDVPAPLVSAGLEVALGRRVGLAGRLGLGIGDSLALYDVAG